MLTGPLIDTRALERPLPPGLSWVPGWLAATKAKRITQARKDFEVWYRQKYKQDASYADVLCNRLWEAYKAGKADFIDR